jgi:hypothetical protein
MGFCKVRGRLESLSLSGLEWQRDVGGRAAT